MALRSFHDPDRRRFDLDMDAVSRSVDADRDLSETLLSVLKTGIGWVGTQLSFSFLSDRSVTDKLFQGLLPPLRKLPMRPNLLLFDLPNVAVDGGTSGTLNKFDGGGCFWRLLDGRFFDGDGGGIDEQEALIL